MATINLNLRIDRDIKEQAELLFGELGMTMTTAFNIFVRQSLRQRKIPFEVSLQEDPFYSESNMAALKRSIGEAQEGRVVSKTLDELRAMEK